MHQWLNYHHLLYFWAVAREGGIVPAAESLRLAPQTVSSQVKALEDAFGERLFEKHGRRLVPTEMGRVVLGFADDIFALGRELVDTVQGRGAWHGRTQKLQVGIAQVLPKLICWRLLEPVSQSTHAGEPFTLVCREDAPARLVADLAAHKLDVVLTDAPVSPDSSLKVFNHLLGESAVAVFGVESLAKRYRKNFPRSLDGAPMLLPTVGTTLRRSLDVAFDALEVRPSIVGEFEDHALMKAFGREGAGLFVGPTAIAKEIQTQYECKSIGVLDGVRERFYAVTLQRKLQHPAVIILSENARRDLFAQHAPAPKKGQPAAADPAPAKRKAADPAPKRITAPRRSAAGR